ncbi:MAG: polyprenyl synthetase family protein [Barnesiella sp.]|nr:polyprenyl synthetase family protein [Barnesiella sp.]MBD5248812.1 polyprenyl synthetase family protein [Barnesiella sp.]
MTLKEIQQQLAPELERMNNEIVAMLHSSNPLINEIVTRYLKVKGKQIRPLLVLLSAGMFGKITEKAIVAGASVELLHNASLVHDDVIDETKMRRGEMTINGIWDNRIAVLMGDFFVSSALCKAIETDNIRIINSVTRLGLLLSTGELDQIFNAMDHSLSEESYFRIIYHKTASLFISCVEIGAFAADAPEEQIKLLAEYARLLGLCFQIRDDIFDYFSDEKIGKPTGNDLREGKVTLPLLHTLITPGIEGSEEMKALVKKEQLTNQEINSLIEFAKANGGIDYAYETMERLRREAEDVLRQLPQNETVDVLRQLFDFVIAREK